MYWSFLSYWVSFSLGRLLWPPSCPPQVRVRRPFCVLPMLLIAIYNFVTLRSGCCLVSHKAVVRGRDTTAPVPRWIPAPITVHDASADPKELLNVEYIDTSSWGQVVCATCLCFSHPCAQGPVCYGYMHARAAGGCVWAGVYTCGCVCVYVLILSKLLDLPVPQSPDLYLPIGCSED